MSEFRVIIAAGRSPEEYEVLCPFADRKLARVSREMNVVVLSDVITGVQRAGECYARERGYQIQRYISNRDRYGTAGADHQRDLEMIADADALIAVWKGRGKRIQDLIHYAKGRGLKVAEKLLVDED